MASHVQPLPDGSTGNVEHAFPPDTDDREQFVESPGSRNRSGRGLLTGVLIGAGMWAAILSLTGVIKL